jgi:hypothetical protein
LVHIPTLFIDKLSITIPIAEDEHQGILERLDTQVTWHGPPETNRTQATGCYRLKYRFAVPNGELISVFASPRRAANFLKLEYSPNNIDIVGRDALSDLLQTIIGNHYQVAFYAGAVNRLDVAFDIHRIPLSDLWVSDSQSKKSAVIRGEDIRTETVYLPFRATRQLCVYDKRQQLLDTDEHVSTAQNSPAIVRFEYRYDKADYILNEFVNRVRGNPFERFTVRQYRLIPELGDSVSRLLFDALRLQGEEQVLARIGAAEKEVYRRAIDGFPVPEFWRRRTSIWGQLNARINDLIV